MGMFAESTNGVFATYFRLPAWKLTDVSVFRCFLLQFREGKGEEGGGEMKGNCRVMGGERETLGRELEKATLIEN
jgi:hypothetical protein